MKLYPFLFLLIVQELPVTASADNVWIFSGQSNMQKIGSSAQRAVARVVEKLRDQDANRSGDRIR